MLIDCDDCAVRDLACRDCVVTVLLRAPESAVAVPLAQAGSGLEVDEGERLALDVLADSGLVPRLRLVPLGPPGGSGSSGTASAGAAGAGTGAPAAAAACEGAVPGAAAS